MLWALTRHPGRRVVTHRGPEARLITVATTISNPSDPFRSNQRIQPAGSDW
jgi:hypothetical protein